ncbi:hypothetical protein [Chryseobacterium polytrichastri]|uniref:Uncharacterized protein n=1 Tax=Chryseobacterium polytrichastri TaxID=1302687 RepID=A0A1M7H0B4_9FLAO|nr:hypothetical protein [Chryseobacterium polytrichastri]SHM22001.1 hypothetical protein SAMN05444267_103836 [Chryseobacterium polytrichastri]
MGIGFVILIHLIVIFIVSIIIAVVGSIITYFISNKQKIGRKISFAVVSPFIGLYTLYFCGIIGSSIVSEYKKVDIGIGDAWYVPLENNHQLIFIDLPKYAFIGKEDNGQLILSEVVEIEENGRLVFGKTLNNKYFSYNTKTDEVKDFNNEKELIIANSGRAIKLTNVYDFYAVKRDDIAGNWFIAVGILSLIISITVLYILKLIMAI